MLNKNSKQLYLEFCNHIVSMINERNPDLNFKIYLQYKNWIQQNNVSYATLNSMFEKFESTNNC